MQKQILLVDDNEDLLLITQMILKSQGFAVALAKTAGEAEAAIAAALPALILVDVNLDGDDGAAFCRQLKETPATKDIRVILMSGDEECSTWAGAGADDFLAKPFDFTELVSRVSAQLAASTQPVT